MQDLALSPESPPILVIEDDSGHLRTLTDILDSEGLQPISCQTGQEALIACEKAVHMWRFSICVWAIWMDCNS